MSSSPRIRRATSILTGLGALSTAFVMAPAMNLGATAPAAAPAATVKPATPTTRTVALATHAATVAAQAGPTTKIPAAPFTNNPARRVVDATGLGTDAVVEVPATGDLVGVTWPVTETSVTGKPVLVRVQTADGWKDWHKVTIDATNAQGAARLGTEPIWEPGAQRVQIRVAAADKGLLKTAALAAVTAPAAGSDQTLATAATAVPGAAAAAFSPRIITRAQWGANESLKKCPVEYDATTKAVVVHHTADTNSYSASDSPRMLRSIMAYETGTLGWCDLAYNVVVDKYGQMFEGRSGGLTRAARGAHAYAFNRETFGASILGNYDTTSVPWAGFNALANVITMRLDSFYLDAYAKVSLTSGSSGGTTRYPAGTVVTLNRIGGHRDTSYTACPGRYLYPRLGELRNLVASKLTYKNSALYKKYMAAGGPAAYGAVTNGERTVWAGTKAVNFTSGKAVYSGPTGTFLIGPGTQAEWLGYGGGPVIGNLASDETTTGLGTFTKLDSGRYITWARSGGRTSLINGGLLSFWLRTGGAYTSPYGMAVARQSSNWAGWWQPFANGSLYFARAGQAYGTLGAMDAAYQQAGGPTGPLGFPRSAQYASGGGIRQDFVGGSLVIAGGTTTRLAR